MACAATMLCLVVTGALDHDSVEVSLTDVSFDDTCATDDTECALSLRQLRGELQVKASEKVEAVETRPDVTPGDGVFGGVGGNVTTEAAGGACVGQTGWDTDFGARAYSCAFRTMANAERSGRCMAHWQGVSDECGKCMGYLINCGLNCKRECCFGRCYKEQNCITCGAQHCGQDFLECAGVPPPAAGR